MPGKRDVPCRISEARLRARPPALRRLVLARHALGMTQRAVAQVLGIHMQSYTDVERGVLRPSPELRDRINDFYGISE